MPFMVPFLQDDYVTGREEMLAQVDLIGEPSMPTKHRRDALVGLGGVG